jgi:transitional endoplasmic reticulum ATPase
MKTANKNDNMHAPFDLRLDNEFWFSILFRSTSFFSMLFVGLVFDWHWYNYLLFPVFLFVPAFFVIVIGAWILICKDEYRLRHVAETPTAAAIQYFMFLRVLPFPEFFTGLVLYHLFGSWELWLKATRWFVHGVFGMDYALYADGWGFFGPVFASAVEGIYSWWPLEFAAAIAFWLLVGYLPSKENQYYYYRGSPKIWEKQKEESRRRERLAALGVQPGQQSQIMFQAKRPRYTFEDVIGMERTKARLKETVENFKKDGGNGILLSGDPGNGKTLLAESLAGELGWNFLEARANEIVSMWMGEAPMRVTQMFKDAQIQAPVVLFFDEFDTFMTDRGSMSVGSAAEQNNRATANALLTEIAALNKGLKEHEVLIVAATNFRDELDEAGTREGRFDAKVQVEPPDFKARMTLLMLHVPKDAKVERESVEMLVRRWEDWSASRLVKLSERVKQRLEKDPGQVVDANFLRSIVDEMAEGVGTRLSEMALSFKDLHFAPDLKEVLMDLAKMVKEPELVERIGATVPRGAIFYGPAGTGKTAAAQAFAKEVGCRFIATSATELLSDPKRVDDIIKKARDARPAIIFIDEAYDLLRDRQTNPYGAAVTNKLLAVMDGPRKLHDVFFIAATNFVDDLDEAMLRPGRFSEHLDFTPSESALLKFVRQYTQERSKIVWKGDLKAFVARHAQSTPAKIKGVLDAMLRRAALNTPKEQQVVVNLDEL